MILTAREIQDYWVNEYIIIHSIIFNFLIRNIKPIKESLTLKVALD